jgi:hypothetical protein
MKKDKPTNKTIEIFQQSRQLKHYHNGGTSYANNNNNNNQAF